MAAERRAFALPAAAQRRALYFIAAGPDAVRRDCRFAVDAYRQAPAVGRAMSLAPDALLPEIPRPADDLLVHLVGLDAFLRGQRRDRPADADRLQLEPRVDLRIDGAKHCDLQRRTGRDIAMSAHQHDRLVAETLGERPADLTVADQHVGRVVTPNGMTAGE